VCLHTPLLNNCSLWRSFKFNSFIHLDAWVLSVRALVGVYVCVCVCVLVCFCLFICLVLLCWRGDVREAAMAGWATGMRGAWAWYQSRLLQQPVRTQMVTSGILWAAGDAMAQSVSRVMEKRSAARDNSTTTTVRARSLSVSVFVSLPLCDLPSAVEIWTTTTNRSTSCSELNSGFLTLTRKLGFKAYVISVLSPLYLDLSAGWNSCLPLV
jgi:hypothetical protein